jgi:HD-like signal output (HDOD) protein
MPTTLTPAEISLHHEICQAGARLPSSAQIFERINYVLKNPDVSAKDIIDTIKQDPAVALRVLRMANSVQFVRGEPFANLELAIDWIGLTHLYHLLAVTASANLFCEDLPHYGLTSTQLWRNAIATATAMQLIAEPAGEDPRRAYTIGLFRPVGRMILQRMAKKRQIALPAQAMQDHQSTVAWEKHGFGLTSAETVTHLFSSWGLSAQIGECIRHHWEPQEAPDSPYANLTALLHVACWMGREAGFGLAVESDAWSATPDILALAHLPKFRLDPYVLRTQEITHRLTAASQI